MIRIKDLGFSYGENVVLKDITMNLEEGRIYGLLGENGVGKTTLLTLLSGLKNAKAGHIDIDGHNPWKREPSLLTEIYYLSDEVAEINMKAIEYAENYGKFWEGFDLNKFIEIRNHDCVNKELLLSIMAMYKGLLYNSTAMDEVEDLLREFKHLDYSELRYEVPRFALHARIKHHKVGDIAKEMINIAEKSLKEQKWEISSSESSTPCFRTKGLIDRLEKGDF